MTKDELDKNWKDVPKGAEQMAIIHSHGEYDRDYDDENFSEPDKEYAANKGVDSYLVTPGGDMKVLRDNGVGDPEKIADNYFDADPNSPEYQKKKGQAVYFNNFKNPDDVDPLQKPNTDLKPIKDKSAPIHDKNIQCFGCYVELPPWLQNPNGGVSRDNQNN